MIDSQADGAVATEPTAPAILVVTPYDVSMLRRHAEQFALIGDSHAALHLRDLALRLEPHVTAPFGRPPRG